MIDERLKYALCSVAISNYQKVADDFFNIDIKIDKIKEGKNAVYFGDDKVIVEQASSKFSIYHLSNHISVVIDSTTIYIDYEDSFELYEYFKLSDNKILLTSVGYDIIDFISVVEIVEKGDMMSVGIVRCWGDDYTINPIDNFWMSVLNGVGDEDRSNIYCIKSKRCGLWIRRRDGHSQIATSNYYPSSMTSTLEFLTQPGKYTIYNFKNLKLSTVVYEHPDEGVTEKDMILTPTTIQDCNSSKIYKRVQKGTSVYYK